MDKLNLKLYSCENRIKDLVNNELLSDVCFEVGVEKVKIYGHKIILSLGSPVFYRMFYGDLKEDRTEPILIPDLTADGFLNMIKYIYGYTHIIWFPRIYESYKACDKYLVYDFKESILNCVYDYNCIKISCFAYDQLLKIDDESSVSHKDYFKKIIQLNSKLAFESDYFCYIDMDTLIDILKTKDLNIDEIDLLIALERWISFNFKKESNSNPNLDNKRDLFKLIGNYISYDKIKIEELSKFKNIKEIFTNEEIGQLFLHITSNDDFFIDYCKIQRNEIKLSIISADKYDVITDNLIEFTLKVDKNLFITAFRTSTLDFDPKKLRMLIYNEKKELPFGKYIEWTIFKGLNSENAVVMFDDIPFLLKANVFYKIAIHFDPMPSDQINYLENFNDLNESLELKYGNDDEEQIRFQLNFKKSNHIEKIKFCTL